MRNPRLTQEQQFAIEATSEPIVLTAAAGSGKTTVLVHHYCRLLENGYRPTQILTLTFTNEAADQLKTRIIEKIRSESASPELITLVEQTRNIGTLHSFCYHTLNRFGSVIKLPAIEHILSDFEKASQFDYAYRHWLESLNPETLQRLLGYFSHTELRTTIRQIWTQKFSFRNSLRNKPEDKESPDAQLIQLLSKVTFPLLENLDQTLLHKGCYSFDDLEQLTLQLLGHSTKTREYFSTHLKRILVDEFQDTSPIQWAILNKLIKKDHAKLFVVGDPMQSIYRFRNADVRVFQNASQEIKKAKGTLAALSTNFRSHPNLIQNINTIGATLFQDSPLPFAPMQAGNTEFENTEVPTLKIERYTKAKLKAESQDNELQKVLTSVQNLIDEGTTFSDIAILFRVSEAIPKYFEALAAQNIPATCKRSGSLFQVYDVLGLTAYLKTLYNPLDDFALACFLRSPYVGYSYQDIWNLYAKEGTSLFEKLTAFAPPSMHWVLNLIERGEMNVDALLKALFHHTNYWPEHPQAILTLLSQIPTTDWNVSRAVEEIERWEKEDIWYEEEEPTTAKALSLMTVHAAKGLEYDHVFIVDNLRQPPQKSPPLKFKEDSFPGIRYRQDNELVSSPTYESIKEQDLQANIEESKRILYVAMTRAKKSLTILLPKEIKKLPNNSWAMFLEEALINP